MSRYKALLQEQADLKAEWDGIIARAETDSRVDLMAEETARVGEIRARLGKVGEGLQQEEERRSWERAVPAAPGPSFSQARDRATDRPWGYDTVGCELAEFVARDARRYLPASHRDHPANLYMRAGDGEFLQAVVAAGSPPGDSIGRFPTGRTDPRLFADVSGASTGDPTSAGYLVRREYTTRLLEAAQQESQLMGLCDSYPVGDGNDGIEAPMIDETSRASGSRMGGVRVYRRAEAATVTDTNFKTRLFSLRLEDLMALSYATDRTIRDALQFERINSVAFASEFAFKLDDEIVRGTGAGQILGFTLSGALVTVAKETGQAAATIVNENISKMWARLWVRSRSRAVWLYNQDCEPQLDKLVLVSGVSALEPRFVIYGPDGVLRIKGRPAIAIEQAETLGTLGDFSLVDLSQMLLITKGGIRADQSMHVRFVYGENCFRWMYPINGKPKWEAVLTPYKGTANTVSPFVVLAARA